MPTKIRIVNGPGHSTLMLNGPMFKCFFNCFFTITGEDGKPVIEHRRPEDRTKPCKLQGLVVGVVYDEVEDIEKVGEEYTASPGSLSLIFRHRDISGAHHYFVFRYKLIAKTGEGWYFTEEEYFTDKGLMRSESVGKYLVNAVTRTLLTPLDIRVGQPKK